MNPPDTIARLNAALEGRYRIERELGEGGMAAVYFLAETGDSTSVAEPEGQILVINWFTELRERMSGS